MSGIDKQELIRFYCIQCGIYKKTLNHFVKGHIIHVTDLKKTEQYHEILLNSETKKMRYPVNCPADCPMKIKRSKVTETALLVADRILKQNLGDDFLDLFLQRFKAIFENERYFGRVFKYLKTEFMRLSLKRDFDVEYAEKRGCIRYFKNEIIKEMKKNGLEYYENEK